MRYLRVFSFISLMFFIGCENMTEAPVSESPSSKTGSFSKVTLPDGAVIESAILNLYIIGEDDRTVDVFKVASEWSELEVSWNERLAGIPWGTAGGDLGSLIGILQANNIGWTTLDITSAVDSWLSGTANNGLLLDQQFSSTSYISSEHLTDPSLRPKLVVTYNLNGLSTIVVVQRTIEGDVYDSQIDERFPNLKFGAADGFSTRTQNNLKKRALIQFDIDQEDIPDSPGTGTPGYWKNHPEAWPVDEITIGGVTYSKEEAIAFMQSPVKKDKTFNLFMHLVSAKLNLLIGNDGSCISEEIDISDDWMVSNGPVGSGVAAKSDEWQSISGIFTSLDEYNNGWLCAPHRD